MSKKNLLMIMVMICMTVMLPSCGGGSESSSSDEYYEESDEYSDESSDAQVLIFKSSRDVLNYLNGKTFSGDGMNVRFTNNGQSVDVNGSNISNNVRAYDMGLNDNGVAYATVQIVNPAGVTTTFTLLAVEGQAQLIDPNDGTVYEY